MSGLRLQNFASSSSWRSEHNILDDKDDDRDRHCRGRGRMDDHDDRDDDDDRRRRRRDRDRTSGSSDEGRGGRGNGRRSVSSTTTTTTSSRFVGGACGGPDWSRREVKEEEEEDKKKFDWDQRDFKDERMAVDVGREEEDGLDVEEVFRRDKESEFGKQTYLQTAKKGEKETFYCEICMIELNSRETRKSHVAGEKHRLMVAREPKDSKRTVKKIPNPLTLRKKIPQRLNAKIKNSAEPFVGLKFVEELIPESNDEMEPRYKCTLCANEGEANSMFNHLLGKIHRMKVFCHDFPRRARDIEAMGTYELMKMAGHHAENEHTDRYVDTTRSDDLYPWPAGKAPWSIEQGGEGGRAGATGRFGNRIDIPMNIGEINKANVRRFLDYLHAAVLAVEEYTFSHQLWIKSSAISAKTATSALTEDFANNLERRSEVKREKYLKDEKNFKSE